MTAEASRASGIAERIASAPAPAAAPTPEPTTPGGSGATGAAALEITGEDGAAVGAPEAGITEAAAAAAAGRGMSDPNGGNGPIAAGIAAAPLVGGAAAGVAGGAAGAPLAAETGAGPWTNPAFGAPPLPSGSLGGTGGISGVAGADPWPEPRPWEKLAGDAIDDAGDKLLAGEKFPRPLAGTPPPPRPPGSPPGRPPPPKPPGSPPPPGNPDSGGIPGEPPGKEPPRSSNAGSSLG
ncbi:hypothetical protein [Mycobacterium sp.]|uniref:hypothetical protein n=1 Tax=Mycobacterium sp. TaxID=1785 RepID=UPI003D0D2B5F